MYGPPTAYDRLIQAAGSLAGCELFSGEYDPAGPEARAFLAANADALSAARRELGPECSVPLRYDADFFEEHIPTFEPLRQLCQALSLSLRLNAADGRFSAAVRDGLDLLELANATRRGGLVMDFLVGVAFTSIGLHGLSGLRRRLAEEDRARLIPELRRLEDQSEPLADILARDEEWERAAGYRNDGPAELPPDPQFPPLSAEESGLSEDQQKEIQEHIQAFAALPVESVRSMQAVQDTHCVAVLRLLTLDLALRSWQEARGAYPDDLSEAADLLPGGNPTDPFTGGPFRYQRRGMDFVLYSPGPTGADHGGTFGPWPRVLAGEADLSLDGQDIGGP